MIDENSLSSGIQETTPDQGHTLPILQKIIDLSISSGKFRNLKKEHTVLSDQVKQITDSFPGPEVVNTLQLLNTQHELLKKKCLQESSERKRLYNEVIELKGNIRVFCRCIPLNQNEITNGSTTIIDFDSSQDNELQVICSDFSKKQFKSSTFRIQRDINMSECSKGLVSELKLQDDTSRDEEDNSTNNTREVENSLEGNSEED
ncbi:hypothetical protein SO802_001217 [Lithocarpus litseifolius]|uniref:Kinesin motor domain-containing protein n=1 Tax=Lithocarpus litseifolius TaxID=425828 RepID=A0AAW2DU29_9ROSI